MGRAKVCESCDGEGYFPIAQEQCAACEGSGYADGHSRDTCSRCGTLKRLIDLHIAADEHASIVCEPCMHGIDIEVENIADGRFS